jgi:hypothetical protein
MKKQREWKVTHHFLNPRREEIEFHTRKEDAIQSARSMETNDYEDEQYSEIENVRTGRRGSRRWGRRRIIWQPNAAAKDVPISIPNLITDTGIQLAFVLTDAVKPLSPPAIAVLEEKRGK